MKLTLPIDDVAFETPRTRRVRLSLSEVDFSYCAGQSVMVGAPGQEQRKPYSIACSPEQAQKDGELELLIQVGADGSAGTHLGVPKPGMLVDVEGPYGIFCFPSNPSQGDFLFVAGGTGIAPLRAMLWHAVEVLPGARLSLVYSARSAEEFAYGTEMRELARSGRLALRETVTRDESGPWSGARGRITRANIELLLSEVGLGQGVLCFVCGPPAMVLDLTEWLQELGVAPERILFERH